MIGALLVGEAGKAGFIEAISEDLGGADAASVVEVEFKVTTVTRCIWIHKSFGISKGVKEGTQGMDLVCDTGLFLGMCGESENLCE
jgi:hypothetical protein